MPTYFHGWQRKLGLVTLGIACIVLLVWVDSLNGDLTFVFAQIAYGRGPGSSVTRSIGIYQNSVELRNTRSTPRRVSNIQNLDPVTLERYEKMIVIYKDSDQSSDTASPSMASPEMPEPGQEFLSVDGNYTTRKRSETEYFERLWKVEKVFSIPLWSIDIPLTLLSAYLLLVKPREKNTLTKSP